MHPHTHHTPSHAYTLPPGYVPIPRPSTPASAPRSQGINLHQPTIAATLERRRRRRVPVQPMYTHASLRILTRKEEPLDAHVLDLSETGIALEVDHLIPRGTPVTLEFTIAGLGTQRQDHWPAFALAAEVVRHDDVDDFPLGPYRIAFRFVKIPTMTQAQIARFIATQPG